MPNFELNPSYHVRFGIKLFTTGQFFSWKFTTRQILESSFHSKIKVLLPFPWFFRKHDYELKTLQPVKRWVLTFILCQSLNQVFHSTSDFQLKIYKASDFEFKRLQSVRCWKVASTQNFKFLSPFPWLLRSLIVNQKLYNVSDKEHKPPFCVRVWIRFFTNASHLNLKKYQPSDSPFNKTEPIQNFEK